MAAPASVAAHSASPAASSADDEPRSGVDQSDVFRDVRGRGPTSRGRDLGGIEHCRHHRRGSAVGRLSQPGQRLTRSVHAAPPRRASTPEASTTPERFRSCPSRTRGAPSRTVPVATGSTAQPGVRARLPASSCLSSPRCRQRARRWTNCWGSRCARQWAAGGTQGRADRGQPPPDARAGAHLREGSGRPVPRGRTEPITVDGQVEPGQGEARVQDSKTCARRSSPPHYRARYGNRAWSGRGGRAVPAWAKRSPRRTPTPRPSRSGDRPADPSPGGEPAREKDRGRRRAPGRGRPPLSVEARWAQRTVRRSGQAQGLLAGDRVLGGGTALLP